MTAPSPTGPRAAGRPHSSPDELVERLRAGDRRALARAITLVENGDPAGAAVFRELYPSSGGASLVGVTGAPGVGKSSLLSAMLRHLRASDPDTGIGIVSVDPSSPFTHGALLGDRIRLADHFLDPNVFIRSMGTRGHLGGLAQATMQVALLMDAFGMDEVLLETVGVGQSEIEIARMADTVLLVLMPGAGDAVQALKAGIMEIPDVIVVNKADHPAARELHNQVRSILLLDTGRQWMPPIVETQAVGDVGLDKLWSKVLEHRKWLGQEGRLQERRRRNLEAEVFALASAQALERIRQRVRGDARLRAMLDGMHRREVDPLTTTTTLFEEVFG